MSHFARRVNAGLLPTVVGHIVCFAGQVLEQGAGFLIVQTSDKGRVRVVGVPAGEYIGHFEFVGKVDSADTVTFSDLAVLGDSFDMDNYDALVQFAQNPAFAPLLLPST